jgi:predicted amidohydrolase
MIKLAMAQMLVEPGRRSENLARAEQRIAEAAQRDAQIVVLPEAVPLGWTDPSSQKLADEIPAGETCNVLRNAARRHGLFVCSGVVERDGDQVFNAAVLIDPAGDVILRHRKINELDFAKSIYALGDRVQVAETRFGRIGLIICADGFAPGQVISRTLALMGAKLILSPCAWAVPADHDNEREPYGQLWLDNYGPVCREFGISICGVSNVGPITAGPWRGRKCIGNSLLMGPGGEVLAWGPYGENADTVVLADWDL